MNDANVIKVISLGLPVTAVLLIRSSWIHASRIEITAAFPQEPILWRLKLYSENNLHLRDIYCQSETIAGISVERHNNAPSPTDPDGNDNRSTSADLQP